MRIIKTHVKYHYSVIIVWTEYSKTFDQEKYNIRMSMSEQH